MNFYGTLGMACAEEETLYQMFRAGMTGARLNLSHTNLKESGGLLNCFRAAAERAVAKAEERMFDLTQEMEAAAADYLKLQDLYEQKEALEEEILKLYGKWEDLSAQLEEARG